jgi:hypothetical protein
VVESQSLPKKFNNETLYQGNDHGNGKIGLAEDAFDSPGQTPFAPIPVRANSRIERAE